MSVAFLSPSLIPSVFPEDELCSPWSSTSSMGWTLCLRSCRFGGVGELYCAEAFNEESGKPKNKMYYMETMKHRIHHALLIHESSHESSHVHVLKYSKVA
jgi:hypothetical protein